MRIFRPRKSSGCTTGEFADNQRGRHRQVEFEQFVIALPIQNLRVHVLRDSFDADLADKLPPHFRVFDPGELGGIDVALIFYRQPFGDANAIDGVDRETVLITDCRIAIAM